MFFGWKVVGTAFLLAVWSSGFGLYGLSVYLVELRHDHPWSTAAISAAITGYWLIGAVLMANLGGTIRRFGPRPTVLAGIAAMAAGVFGLTAVAETWQLHLVLACMALGWATTSSAAINMLLAPWFERRRGLAVSLALAGAPTGGFIVAPALVALTGHFGFRAGAGIALLGMLAVLVPCVMATLGRKPEDIGIPADGLQTNRAKDVGSTAFAKRGPSSAVAGAPLGRAEALRTLRYWSLSVAFAAALTAQIGVLTHLMAYLTPIRGASGAAVALSVATATALAGRLVLGVYVDRLHLRALSSVVFLTQALGLALLALVPSGPALIAGCLLFGFGIGNVVTLPGLLVQREFRSDQFAGVLSLVAATNQVTFAFGPGILGVVHDMAGGYSPALGLAGGLDVAAAILILLGARKARSAVPALLRS